MSTPRMAAPHDVTADRHDVELARARWWKSSYSGGANDCVEVAELGERAAVRDSKDIGRRPLLFSKAAMRALVSEIARGPIGERWG
ncbi:DUF397 domain-containing protein [Streptomyces griseorubiginosus]|uniref:DUF397 domain-containing protein n=1 Tax=Streptomyces griseorubiginosus TaxID=67304 RepID=UPI00281689D2|nr:DUF397 domain-containing protein [Streptomyces griseorubiginosus]